MCVYIYSINTYKTKERSDLLRLDVARSSEAARASPAIDDMNPKASVEQEAG